MVRVDPFQLLICHITLSATCQGFVPSTTSRKSRSDGSNGRQKIRSALNEGFPGSSGGGNVVFSTMENSGAIGGDFQLNDPRPTTSDANYQQQSMSFEEFCKYGSDSTSISEQDSVGGIPEYTSMPPTPPTQQQQQQQPQQQQPQDPYAYYGTVYPGSQQQQLTQIQQQQTTSPFQSTPQSGETVDVPINEDDLFFTEPNLFFTNDSEYSNANVINPDRTHNARENLVPNPTLRTQDESQKEDDDIDLEDRYLKMVSNEVSVKQLIGANPYAITDVPADVMVGRALDIIEDNFQKKNGKLRGQAKLKGKKEPKKDRPTVIVLGTGWAAHAFIKCASTYDLRIVVVSPVNHFVFTPMLASAAVGTIEYRSMTEPIRVTNPLIDNYVEGRAIGVDVKNKVLKVRLSSLSTVSGTFRGVAANAPCRLEPEPDINNSLESQEKQDASQVIELTYDCLVCSVGTSVRSNIVPGAKEHCFNLKTSQDSKRLRTAIGEALEYASRPDVQEAYYDDPEQKRLATAERRRRLRFVLVGGGPTGVELAGELSDFFAQVCSTPDGAFQHLAQDVSVTLVHGGSEVLPQMDKDLRQRALEALKAQGVEVRLNTRLKEVGRDFVRIGEKDKGEEETIPVSLTVWAAGNAPVPFVSELLSQLPESAAGSAGRINVDNWLRCPTPTPDTFGSILVLGDVACLEAQSKYDEGPSPLPQTAQVAGQQGEYAARMLNRQYNLNQTPPKLPEKDPYDEYSLLRAWLLARSLEEAPEFTFLNLGLLAYVGGGEALNQVKIGDVPIFNYSGRIAFALWKTVYLSKQAATRNQALISFDWLRTELFGRDITRL